MSMNLSLNLSQQQKMVMTMQMHQAFQLLQVTGQELEDALLEEMRENPLLEFEEVERALTDTELEQLIQYRDQQAENLEANNGSDTGEIDWDALIESGVFTSDNKGVVGGYAFWDMPAPEENYSGNSTLYEHLIEQFRLEISTDGERRAGEFILASLDNNGFLDTTYDEITLFADDVDMDDVEGAILIIRELEPIGCGARDMIESLVFQAEILYPEDPFFPDLIRNHLDAFYQKEYDVIAKIEDMDPEDVEEYHRMLLKLDPRPGNAFGGTVQPSITPDVQILKVGNEWTVVSNDDGVPKVRLNQKFLKMMRQQDLSKEDKQFVEEYRKKAEFFLHSLQRREQTITRVTRSILSRQMEYFEFGEEYLRPLNLSHVADDTGLHESTVSRSTANKYVETPNGVLELKWLFCSGVTGTYGEEYAAQAIQCKIRRFVNQENRVKPYSDQAMQNMLADEGIQIARRTITKYREAIGIGSSRERKRTYANQSWD